VRDLTQHVCNFLPRLQNQFEELYPCFVYFDFVALFSLRRKVKVFFHISTQTIWLGWGTAVVYDYFFALGDGPIVHLKTKQSCQQCL
jgi:hypothetical protein